MRLRFLLLLALLLWTPAWWLRPPSRQQELRVLISARNMTESGDYLRPQFQNQPRYRKPPLAYWLAAAGQTAFDSPRSAAAGRLLFLLTGLGVLTLITRLTASRGVEAGLALLFSFGMLSYSPLAETDLPQLAGVMLAMTGWRRNHGVWSGLGMAAGALSKGPGALLIPLLCFVLLQRRYPRDLRFWRDALWIPLVALSAWMLFLLGDEISRAALRDEWRDTFWKSPHANPWFYYFYTLPLLSLPAGLWIFFRKNPVCPPDRESRDLLLCWLTVTFLLLSLTVSKQRHYALLLLPPLFLLLSQSRTLPIWLRRPRNLLAIGLVLSMGQTFYFARSPDAAHASFLRQTAPQVAQAKMIHVSGINSAIFDFHLGRHVENTDTPAPALRRARPGEAVVVIVRRDQAEMLPPGAVLSKDDAKWLRRLYVF